MLYCSGVVFVTLYSYIVVLCLKMYGMMNLYTHTSRRVGSVGKEYLCTSYLVGTSVYSYWMGNNLT